MAPCYTGKQDEAIERLKKVIVADPEYWQPYYFLGSAYLYKSEPEEAIKQLQKATELSGGASVARAMLTCALYLDGRDSEAEKQYELLAAREKESYVAPVFFTWINIVRNNVDEGYRWLQKAKEARDSWICWSRINPEVLQSGDPRYEKLLDEIGLP